MIDVNEVVMELIMAKKSPDVVANLLVKLGRAICETTRSDSFEIKSSGSSKDVTLNVVFKGVLHENSERDRATQSGK